MNVHFLGMQIQQIQKNKFPGGFQEIFYKIPVDFFTVIRRVVNQEVMYQHGC